MDDHTQDSKKFLICQFQSPVTGIFNGGRPEGSKRNLKFFNGGRPKGSKRNLKFLMEVGLRAQNAI
jgi:hypothetical protein